MKKSFSGMTVKSADEGTISAVFSTFGVIDKDGDVTVKGAIADGTEVVISAYGHSSWEGALPVGKGVIRTTDSEAVLDGQFFLNTTAGRETFEVVKHLGDLQEYSYSLHQVKSRKGEHDGRQVRFLDSIYVKEVSPVLRGAGEGTRTIEVKADQKQLASSVCGLLSAAGRARWGERYRVYTWLADYDLDASIAVFAIESEDETRLVQVAFARTDTSVELADDETEVHQTAAFLPKAQKFSEHATTVMADVDALIARATDVVALRAEKGKPISPASLDLLKQIDEQMGRLKALIAEPTHDTVDIDEDQTAIDREFLRFVALSQGATTP